MQPQHLNGLDAPVAAGVKIKIGASEYEPQWNFYGEYLLALRGTTLQEVLAETNSRGKRTLPLAMELIAACVAHHFPAGAAPSAEALALQMREGQFKPAWDGCLAAGRAAGKIVDLPKNEEAPKLGPTETAPTA